MATAWDLANHPQLVKYDGSPYVTTLHRTLYLHEDLDRWLNDILVYEPCEIPYPDTPYEQLETFLDDIVSGAPVMPRPNMPGVKFMEPPYPRILQIATDSVRLHGYFYRPNTIIAVTGELKLRMQAWRDYDRDLRKADHFRLNSGLAPPLFDPSGDLRALLHI